MIASGAVPALLPAHIGVSQTSQFTTQSGLCRHPAVGCPRASARLPFHNLPNTARRTALRKPLEWPGRCDLNRTNHGYNGRWERVFPLEAGGDVRFITYRSAILSPLREWPGMAGNGLVAASRTDGLSSALAVQISRPSRPPSRALARGPRRASRVAEPSAAVRRTQPRGCSSASPEGPGSTDRGT
jgi:hypothetical protein